MGGEVLHENCSLPPKDAFLYLPKTYSERIPTALDHNGVVDMHATIDAVKECIDPAYVWDNEKSLHHFQWPDSWYSVHRENGDYVPSNFRNLPISTGLVLREFENVLHRVTLPPPVPDREVMQYRIESWQVVKNLFSAARKTVQWQKIQKKRREFISNNPSVLKEGFNGQDVIGEEIMFEILDKHFSSYESLLEKQESIPEEHRILDISGPPQLVAKRLGRLAAKKKIDYRWLIAS
jgi:hypothetical protein